MPFRDGIEIVGGLPERGTRPQLLILFANTYTERKILQAYADDICATLAPERQPDIAWICETGARDTLSHEGLIAGLSKHSSLDITPIGVAWKPKADSAKSWRKIRRWMRLLESDRDQRTLLRKAPHRAAVIVGEFGTRKALQAKYKRQSGDLELPSDDDPEAFANFVALQAAITVERDSRAATGQTVKYPRYVKRSIWQRPAFQAELKRISEESGTPLEDIKTEARECLKELVPKVRAPHVSMSESFARNVCRLGYDQKLVYDKDKMHQIRELALTRPVAMVWTHKTHIDGMAVILATREEAFPLVHIIGGNNMAFFGIGYLMSRAGTIFIRRKIDSDVYKAVMQEYISYLLEKRFPISWALEGTRSRNGKLMPPRFGILKYVVEAAARKNMTDLTIVPVSIYYDLIAELGDYAREQTGTRKRKESLAWFAGYLRSLRKPLGRISLGLGDPVVVDTTSREFVSIMEAGKDSFSVELQKLAFEASVSANAVTPLTPSSLIALTLTGAAPQALTREELANGFWLLRDWAAQRDLPMTKELRNTDRERCIDLFEAMIEIGVVATYEGGPQTVYSIADGKHFEASYYRNNAIHHFVDKAIIELALLAAAEHEGGTPLDAFWAEIIHLRDTFKFEFFYPDIDTHKNQIIEELMRYDADWESRIKRGSARALLADMTPLVSHAVLRPFAEAYSIVANVLLEQGRNDEADEKTIVAGALKLGRQAFLQRRITSEESIGKLMFQNGYKLAENRALVPGAGQQLHAARQAFARDLDDVTRRLRQIGDIARAQRAKLNGDAARNDPPVRLSVVGKD